AVMIALPIVSRSYRLVAGRMLAPGLPVALVGMLAWPLVLANGNETTANHLSLWFAAQRAAALDFGEPVAYLARTAPWFYWPAWPGDPPSPLPGLTVLAFTLQALAAGDGTESLLLPACAPMAMLAGVGLPTLRRGIVNLIDWFAVTSFTIFGVAIWAWWIALMTGVPPRMAYRAAQIAPGFEPSWIVVEIVLGGLATLAWFALVRWRIARRPRMIWRA